MIGSSTKNTKLTLTLTLKKLMDALQVFLQSSSVTESLLSEVKRGSVLVKCANYKTLIFPVD